MGCGTKLASIILMVFTLLSLLIGLALLGAGIWMLVSQDKLFNVLNMINQQAGSSEKVSDELQRISQQKGVVATAGAILVAAGSISTVISFFGFFGAVKQSKCMLGVYAGIIGVLLAAQITAGVLAVVYKDTAVKLAHTQLLALQEKYLVSVNDFVAAKQQPQTAVSLVFNYMFVALECCGVNSSMDASRSTSWLASNRTWMDRGNMTLPATCCPVYDHARTRLLTQSRWDLLPELVRNSNCPLSGDGAHQVGCVNALLQFIDRYSLWVLVGCIVFAASQLMIILFTICLIRAIKKS